MNYELTEKEMWIQTLLFMVYQPMVSNKKASFPIGEILSQCKGEELLAVQHGLEALVELGVFKMDQKNIEITNRSEALFQGLGTIAGASLDSVKDYMIFNPLFSGTLELVKEEIRLEPPSWLSGAPVKQESSKQSPNRPTGSNTYTLSEKVILGMFLGLMLLGLSKFFK